MPVCVFRTHGGGGGGGGGGRVEGIGSGHSGTPLFLPNGAVDLLLAGGGWGWGGGGGHILNTPIIGRR